MTQRKHKSISDGYKADYMESTSSSKGTGNDPLVRQKPSERLKLADKEISNLYASNGIFSNIVNIPAEDCVREWIDIEGVDQQLKEQIFNKLLNLGAKGIFQEMIKFERLRGDGLISIGAVQKGNFDLKDPITNLLDVQYLHPFSSIRLGDIQTNDDVFSQNYGEITSYKLKGDEERIVDKSRIIHLQTRIIEDEKFGVPIIIPLYDILTILDNAAWSTGQLMYSMVHKVLKSENVDVSNTKKRQKIQADLEYEFNTLSLAVIGKDDELNYIGPSVSMPLGEMYKFIWELLSCITRMPKSHIMGQSQGTITGGQYDSLNYYMRIAGIQESYLREQLEYLIDLLLLATNSGIGEGSLSPDNVPYNIKFNSLWKLDNETDAKIRKMVAETDQIYVQHGVLSPDEVREIRFKNKQSLLEELDMSEEDLDNMAKAAEEAKNNASEN